MNYVLKQLVPQLNFTLDEKIFLLKFRCPLILPCGKKQTFLITSHIILDTSIISVLVAFHQSERIIDSFDLSLYRNRPMTLITLLLFPISFYWRHFFWDGRKRTAHTNLQMGTTWTYTGFMTSTSFIPFLIIPNVWFAFLPTAVLPCYHLKSPENLFQPVTAGLESTVAP